MSDVNTAIDIALDLLDKFESREKAAIGEWGGDSDEEYAELDEQIKDYKQRLEAVR